MVVVEVVRTQVQLTETQARLLHEHAQKGGVSMAALIREAVDAYLETLHGGGRRELVERAKEATGKYHVRLQDLARDHDRYLAEDFQK